MHKSVCHGSTLEASYKIVWSDSIVTHSDIHTLRVDNGEFTFTKSTVPVHP